MDIKTNSIDSANAKVEAKISKEKAQEHETKIAKKIAKDVKIDGFRKGKAPVAVIKKMYKSNIEQDAISNIFQELLDSALKELERKREELIGEPAVKKFDKSEEGGYEIEFEISFRPVIDISVTEECVPEYEKPEVSDEEVDKRVNEILKSAIEPTEVQEDRAVENADIATIDFEGFIDGKAFEGGKAEDYPLEIGSGSFIPGFEDGIVGMKKGESKDIEVTFPEEYANKELAGKKATFKVTVKKIEKREIPENPDEELLKRFLPEVEHPTMDDLKNRVKGIILREKLNKLYMDELKAKMIDALVDKIEFDLPMTVVEQEIEMSLNNLLQSKTKEEIEELKNSPEKVEELRNSLKEGAKESVKLTFIVDELSKEHKIDVSDNEVVQAVYYEAMQQGQDPKKYLEYYQEQGLLPAIKMAMVEDKLFAKLLKLEEDDK